MRVKDFKPALVEWCDMSRGSSPFLATLSSPIRFLPGISLYILLKMFLSLRILFGFHPGSIIGYRESADNFPHVLGSFRRKSTKFSVSRTYHQAGLKRSDDQLVREDV